jgi:hypothetical protein
VKKFSTPGSSLLDPVGYTSWAEEGAILNDKGFITTQTTSDPETLTQIKTQVNDRLQHQIAERQEWDNNPLVKRGLVQIVRTPQGPAFGVLDEQGRVGTTFPTQGQAYGYAQNAYPDPAAAAKAIRAAQDARKTAPAAPAPKAAARPTTPAAESVQPVTAVIGLPRGGASGRSAPIRPLVRGPRGVMVPGPAINAVSRPLSNATAGPRGSGR